MRFLILLLLLGCTPVSGNYNKYPSRAELNEMHQVTPGSKLERILTEKGYINNVHVE